MRGKCSKVVASNYDVVSIPGKLLNVREADVHTGGSVANTGLAMKILGVDVTLMGKSVQTPLGIWFVMY